MELELSKTSCSQSPPPFEIRFAAWTWVLLTAVFYLFRPEALLFVWNHQRMSIPLQRLALLLVDVAFLLLHKWVSAVT